ncbi:hypothetical protein [Teredinibacter franksiae]|uniref:hypothetical protein n=1 Tax=Teredinibacter franksiae TaxID=2761453 RepID=UPI00162AF09D|nr:hypothetical protein [Teredinibacter franksiae]
MTKRAAQAKSTAGLLLACMATLLSIVCAVNVQAQESVCAIVKIEIQQELTLERQAFDAQMKINNALDDMPLDNV